MASQLQATLIKTQFLEFHIAAPESALDDQTFNAELSISVNFNIEYLDDGNARIRLLLGLDPKGGNYYAINMVVATWFQFPPETSQDDKEEYLKAVGVMRTYDAARTAIKSMTAMGVFGPAEIPALNLIMK